MSRIAWIDDDAHVMWSVVEPLQLAGFVIEKYPSLSEATADLARICAADLILLDVIMPPGTTVASGTRYSAADFLRKLRSSSSPYPPVIVFTVIRDRTVLDELEELGAARILAKPVLPSVLKAAVEDVITATPSSSSTA